MSKILDYYQAQMMEEFGVFLEVNELLLNAKDIDKLFEYINKEDKESSEGEECSEL